MTWDVSLFHAINGLAGKSAIVDDAMIVLAHPTTLLVPGALLFAYWWWVSRRDALIETGVLAGLVLLGDLLGAQLKHLVGRVRPCQLLDGVHQLVGCGGTFSFPSNHALNTAAAAAFAQVLYPVTGWGTWPLVALIGLSRVYVGGHYVSDVLAGWIIGGVFGAGVALLLRRWKASQSTRPS